MSQPPPFNRSFSFNNFQAANPSAPPPGSQIDGEFNNAKATLDAINANLKLIQRDDGALMNGAVTFDTLSASLQTAGLAPALPWVTGTAYAVGTSVTRVSAFYRALVPHTAGVFATDLAAGNWVLIVDLSAIALVAANQIAVTPSGNLTTDVQGSLQALDTAKAALSHTQLSSTISDSTAAGRAMLTAADIAAQKSLLSLGTLAFLNGVNVSQIPANLAFINPVVGSLIASANDWSPTGWATAAIIRMTTTSAINITGLAATTDGDIKVIYNTGSFAVTIPFESASSIAANRVTGPAWQYSFIIQPGASCPLMYDGTTARWRVLAPVVQSSSQTIAGGYRNLICGNSAGNNFTAPGTPNTTFKIQCDAATLEDANGNAFRASAISLSPDTGTTGANGFDGTGSLVSAPLFAFVIFNPTTGTAAGLLSRSATTPTMPSGYTFKWRCGATFTNSSSQLVRTLQYGARASYVVSASVTTAFPLISSGISGTLSTTTFTGTSTSIAAMIPSTASAIRFSLAEPGATGGSDQAATAPSNNFSGYASTTNPVPFFLDTQATFTPASLFGEMTIESTNVFYASNGSNSRMFAHGWTDNL